MPIHPLLDSHLHLQDTRFAGIIEDVLLRAANAGVDRMLCNATCERDWPEVLRLASISRSVIPFLGIHPWYADSPENGWEKRLETLVATTSCGIGEAGLDGKCRVPLSTQEAVLLFQLNLAKEYQRPVALHCLGSWGRMIDILERLAKKTSLPPVMIHSFNGSRESMLRLAGIGCWISFSGRLIDSERQRLRQVFLETPLDRILLETDAPDQVPAVQRKSENVQYNEPANIADICRCAARLRRLDFDEFTQQIWNNGEIYANSLLPR